MKTTENFELIGYIETPQRCNAPVKIDEILAARMQVFMRARRLKRFTFVK